MRETERMSVFEQNVVSGAAVAAVDLHSVFCPRFNQRFMKVYMPKSAWTFIRHFIFWQLRVKTT